MEEVIDDVSIIDLLEFVIENDICSVSVEIERDDLLWWVLVPSVNCNCVTVGGKGIDERKVVLSIYC